LVLHDALSVLLGDQGAYTVAMLTVRLCNPINKNLMQERMSNLTNLAQILPSGKKKQLLMLRTAGVVIPVYIILVAVTELLHRRRRQQRQVCLKVFQEITL
jgi:hypothetical protein